MPKLRLIKYMSEGLVKLVNYSAMEVACYIHIAF